MNWDAFGAAGEWAGAIAVVVTLFYLGRQIYQQNQIAKFNASQSVMDGFRNLTAMLATNTELNEIVLRGDFKPETLSDAEARQYQNFYRSYFTIMVQAFNAHKLKFLDENEWSDLASEFALNLEVPGGKLFREGNRTGFEIFWKTVDEFRNPNYVRPDYEMNNRESNSKS